MERGWDSQNSLTDPFSFAFFSKSDICHICHIYDQNVIRMSSEYIRMSSESQLAPACHQNVIRITAGSWLSVPDLVCSSWAAPGLPCLLAAKHRFVECICPISGSDLRQTSTASLAAHEDPSIYIYIYVYPYIYIYIYVPSICMKR